jgi:GT2 family glycosyltransferase
VLDNGTPTWVSNEDNSETTPEEMAEPVMELLRPNHDLFFRVDQNIGYPSGINECVKQGTSPLILILTADVFLEPSAIASMVAVMDNPDVGVVGPKLLFPLEIESPHGPGGTIQHAGLAFGIQGKPYHVFIGWTPDHPKVNIRRDMAAVTGACFMTRRNLWNEVGGFDPRYGLGTFEDIDYCFAIRSAGKQVIYEPTAVGYHLVSGAKLQGANQTGFNLPMNETIFRGKWAHMLAWDEWRYL